MGAGGGIKHAKCDLIKVTSAHLSGRQVVDALHLAALAEPLVVRHEEEAILAIEQLGDRHRAAEREAELVPLEGVLFGAVGGEGIVLGIQFVVAEELIERAVIGVAAALGGDVDLGGSAAEFSGIYTTLHLELLQGFSRGEDHVGVEVRVGVFDTVQREAIEVVALTGNRNILVRAIATLAAIGLASRREAEADIGGQGGEGQVIATIQGKFDDALLLDDRADGGVFGLEHGTGGIDLHRVRNGADFEG